MPAAVMETIMVDHISDSMVANTLPRNSSGTRRSNCETFSTRAYRHAGAGEGDEKQGRARNSASG